MDIHDQFDKDSFTEIVAEKVENANADYGMGSSKDLVIEYHYHV